MPTDSPSFNERLSIFEKQIERFKSAEMRNSNPESLFHYVSLSYLFLDKKSFPNKFDFLQTKVV